MSVGWQGQYFLAYGLWPDFRDNRGFWRSFLDDDMLQGEYSDVTGKVWGGGAGQNVSSMTSGTRPIKSSAAVGHLADTTQEARDLDCCNPPPPCCIYSLPPPASPAGRPPTPLSPPPALLVSQPYPYPRQPCRSANLLPTTWELNQWIK